MSKLLNKIKKIQIIKQYFERQVEKQSKFYELSRKEVLNHYRYLLKTVPGLYQRRLQQRSIYIQICHLFHDSKVLSSIDQQKSRLEHLNKIVGEIKREDYTNIGMYMPSRHGQYYYMDKLFTFWTKRPQ